MSRFEVSLPLLLALAMTLAPGNAAVAAPAGQEQTAPVPGLLAAELRVAPLQPTRATVEATFDLALTQPLDVLITWFPGQALEQLVVTADGVELEIAILDRPGAVRALRIPGTPRALTVRYQVVVPAGYAYRYPLPVPDTTTEAASESVVLQADLPAGASLRGRSFPHLLASDDGQTLRATMVAVPGFTHLVFGDSPATGPAQAPEPGFGPNFYGFFVVAAAWCLFYFGWALAANRRQHG